MSGRGERPGANSRGRGGKFKKFTRGGGKHFSRDLRPLDADGNEVSMWSGEAKKNEDSDEDSSEEESSEEDSDEDSEAGPSKKPELSRDERRAAKKAQKEAAIARRKKQVQVGDLPTDSEGDSDEDEDEDSKMPANPNHTKAARNMTKAPAADVDGVTQGVQKMTTASTSTKPAATMSRREREALEAQQAKERYRKLHEAGKTDEAKADMARLRQIREKREADAARKQAEKEERDAQEAARKAEMEKRESKKREAALGKPAKKGKK
ncbi:hypothetical protein GGR56DRAFT_643895 [Xylariaceae sp. FL0804]|nr:hypothetical protein GGR56DRAFT_643895 [Xylariaceae sp. FL0804]